MKKRGKALAAVLLWSLFAAPVAAQCREPYGSVAQPTYATVALVGGTLEISAGGVDVAGFGLGWTLTLGFDATPGPGLGSYWPSPATCRPTDWCPDAWLASSQPDSLWWWSDGRSGLSVNPPVERLTLDTSSLLLRVGLDAARQWDSDAGAWFPAPVTLAPGMQWLLTVEQITGDNRWLAAWRYVGTL
jgi:hypothetical protein